MKNEEIDKIVLKKVLLRKEELKNKKVDELRNLPPVTIEELDIGGKKLTFCVYRDKLENDETLIIVQCKNTLFLGYGNMFAEGLVINSNGEIREVEEKLMWEYV